MTTSEGGGTAPEPDSLMQVAIRCTVPTCSCDCFSPRKSQIRSCDGCGHSWVSHALDKLGHGNEQQPVRPGTAFDVASLVLYGTHAIPIRLKILLDRLFSVLRQDEVLQLLHAFGWTHEDYARGYIVQDPSGKVLDRWVLASREEEPLVLRQFLRFGETRFVAERLLAMLEGISPPSSVQSETIRDNIREHSQEHADQEDPLHRLENMQPSDFGGESGAVDLSPRKHLRKPAHPVKRRWTPGVLSTLSANPSTGKKRVQCHSCLKTFCDKGALKIHFSAVHLREMHRCTVDGCNMMFSSRRSRNRHSANPNPKLHAPGCRRKLNPHDGRAANPLPPVDGHVVDLTLKDSGTVRRRKSEHPTKWEEVSSSSSSASDGTTSSGTYIEENGLVDSTSDDSTNQQEKTYPRVEETENPLRHLESLSMGSFTTSRDISYHAPGLGLVTPPPPTTTTSDPETEVHPVEIPVDKENPRRCTACGKIFQNHFGVKTHYQNVHLKLMHRCTVEGCNAAFPSKRSRDRHSANLNLHRKLLSTTSDKAYLDVKCPFQPRLFDPFMYHRFPAEGLLFPFLPSPLRADEAFVSRLHEEAT